MLEMLVEMMRQVEANGDGYLDIDAEGDMHFEVNDFEGFADDWSEVDHEFADRELVDRVLDLLEQKADEVEGDYYMYYQFGDVTVVLGCSSFDI